MHHHLTTYIETLTARRERPVGADRKCACCGEPGEFDLFRAAFPADRMDKLRDKYGDECCMTCADRHVTCDWCGELIDTDEDGTGWEHGPDGPLCAEDAAWITHGAERGGR